MRSKKVSVSIVSICLLVIFTICNFTCNEIVVASSNNQQEILEYWAPQVYQDVRNDKVLWHKYYASGDMITKVNYDNDWDSGNNWDNVPRSGQYGMMKAYAYGTYIETETHYFLMYHYYHAMDDAFFSADRHENDVEGVCLAIRKGNQNNGYGQFEAMKTTVHSEEYKYTINDVSFSECHPKVFISSNGDVLNNQFNIYGRGHSIFAYDEQEHNSWVGNDAIVYNVGNEAQYPNNINGVFTNSYTYQILSIDEMWNRRYNIGEYDTFESYGKLNGRDQSVGGDFPWRSESFYDPAVYFEKNFHLSQNGNVSTNYIVNPYN